MPSRASSKKLKHKFEFDAIGTHWSVETREPLGVLREKITKRIDMFDHAYSRFRTDSLVAAMTAKVGTYTFPPDAAALIAFYRELYDATDGAVSPLVGKLLEVAGYDRHYSLHPGVVERAPQWDDAMQWQGATVSTSQPVTLDVGAAGKGYLVDIVAELLESNGHAVYVIDASGDVRTRGESEIIGLENPYDSARVLGVVRVENASLCASASTRRAWGEWHHVVDPRTAKPVDDVVATWVIANSTLLADGVATALFFVPASQLRQWDFQYVRLHSDGTIERSANFVGELYI